MTRRGTVHANDRGSALQRRARRAWLVARHAVAGVVVCALCGVPMRADEDPRHPEAFVVGRIVPGCRGGTYRRSNIRIECQPCSSGVGGAQRAA